MADYVIVNGELYHHGVKGMKWGVRRKSMRDIKNRRVKAEEKGALIYDSHSVKTKAEPGRTLSVTGHYGQIRNRRYYPAMHVVDDCGKVKFSYINGKSGRIAVAAGKEYVDKHLNLNKHFRDVESIDIEYDVYE